MKREFVELKREIGGCRGEQRLRKLGNQYPHDIAVY